MAEFTDFGYDEFFDKNISPTPQELTTIDSDILFQGISGQNILSSGSIRSESGRLNLNLTDNIFSVNDGTIDRVKLGLFEDGQYGLRIVDQAGNVLMNITGKTNLIQSADGRMQLDMTNKQFRVFDATNLRVLLGELS